MRILLTGRHGQVGWELERTLAPLGEVVATDRATLDLADPDAIRRVVREAKPEIIVNAAAYTAVDKAESEPELTMKVNGEAPGILAEEAKRLGALLVHYSTDYVFDGEKRTPYVEDDAPNPLNVYGRTKLEGERRVGASGCRHLVLRTSWVYGPRGKNFFLTIARKALAGNPLRVVDDQVGTPTSSPFLAETTTKLLSLGGEAQGLFHLAPLGSTTWCRFARAIVDRTGAHVSVAAIRTAEYDTPAVRPIYSVLDSSRVTTSFRLPLPTWEALLESCVAQFISEAGR